MENQFGTELPAKVEELSEGIASKGLKYKSHYATILSWERLRIKKGVSHGTSRGYAANRVATNYTEPADYSP